MVVVGGDSTEVDWREEGDMEVEVVMVETGVGEEVEVDTNNREEGIMIDHWIEEQLRKDVVDVRKSVLWVHRGLRKLKKRNSMSSRKRV